MIEKIGIIASDLEMKKSIINLYAEDIEEERILIDILDSERIEEQGIELENQGVKAIIARSGGYRHTVGKVNIPVIHLQITTLDILYAINIASKDNKDVVLLISPLEYFNHNDWKEMINSQLYIERFESKDEIEEKVKKYLNRKEDIVIVGGGIPCSIAREYGISCVHIGASDESIQESISRARELIDSLYEQKYKNEVLKTTLDGVYDAVIAIDKDGKIIIYNKRAEEMLKKESIDVLDKQLTKAYPELSFIVDALQNKNAQNDRIIILKDITIAINISTLKVDGHTIGVLCSFRDITELQSLEKKIRYEMNKKGLTAKYEFDDIIANSSSMVEVIKRAKKIGVTDNTVMIYGESGTGKEMIAQSIHNLSSRKLTPFVAINCAALSESLLESELFGYEEGAFTGARKNGKPGLFELAHGGTIFLDEINSVSLNLQSKLLRVIEEKEVMRIGSDYVIPLDVRIISAANEELINKVNEGKFRGDLFYRLNTLELSIPPLRERKEDIIAIFKYFLKSNGKNIEITDDMIEKLTSHKWLGNVRELRNVVDRFLVFEELELKIYDKLIKENNNSSLSINLKKINHIVEKHIIENLIDKGMNKTEVAKVLGISRTALWQKMN